MKRFWQRLALILLGLIGLSLAGLAVLVAVSGPDFLSGALTQVLGRRVEIGSVDLRIGRALEIELLDVRVYAGQVPRGPPLFEAPRALGSQSWPRLFVGELMPGKWRLESPVVRTVVEASGDGAALPALPPLPPLDLAVSDGTLELERVGELPLRVRELTLTTTRSNFRALVTGSASGRVSVGERPLATVSLELEGWRQEVELRMTLAELDLEVLPVKRAPRWSGTARGRVEVRTGQGDLAGSLDLEIEDFALSIERFKKPVAPRHMRVAGTLAWDGTTLHFEPDPVELDDLRVSGALSAGLGAVGEARRIRGSLEIAPFQPGLPAAGRLHPISLMGLRHQTWANVDQRVESGSVEDLGLDFDLPLADLGTAIAFRRKLAPEELRIRARVRDGVYRPKPESEPLVGISGEVELAGNVLEVHELRMRRHGRPLPRVDVRVDGMHRLAHLPRDERRAPPGPGVRLRGLGPGTRALRQGGGRADRPPLEVRFHDFQIGYTAFVLPIRNARGVMRFPEGRLEIRDAEGVVGGAPARISTVWDPGEKTVGVDLTYLDGEAPPRADPGRLWASGNVEADTLYLGGWRIDRVRGELRAIAGELDLSELRGEFAGGEVRALGSVQLDREGGAPFELLGSVAYADAAGLNAPLGMQPGTLNGSLAVDGRFGGLLTPDRELLRDADFGLTVRLQDGSCDHLPSMVVLARIPSLQGLRGLLGEPLPFDVLSADVTIKDGVLRTRNLALQGPELRVHARGEIDLLSADKEEDVVLALFFLQTVDRVIQGVPIVGRWVLGKDESLVALNLRLRGPWADPTPSIVAPGAVTAVRDLAGELIGGGTDRLLRLFRVRPRPEPEPEPAQEATADMTGADAGATHTTEHGADAARAADPTAADPTAGPAPGDTGGAVQMPPPNGASTRQDRRP